MSEWNGLRVRRWARMCAWFALTAAVPAAIHAAEPTARSESAAAVTWLGAYNKNEWALTVALIQSIPERSRTPVQWLYLARAKEKLSHLVEAVDAYERARELALSAAPSALAREVRRKADAEAAAVARRIPWADISVSAEVPLGAYVFVDEAWLPPARLRSPYPVNPGWHTFLLEVDGEVLAARRVYFAESQQRPVLLEPKVETRTPPASVQPWPAKPAVRAPRPTEPAPVPYASEDRGLRAASYFTLGAGALGVLMGAGFTIRSAKLRDELDDLEAQCSAGFCDPLDARLTGQQVRTSIQIANVSFMIGGLSAVTGGVIYYLSTDGEPKRHERAGFHPVLGLGGAGVAGRF